MPSVPVPATVGRGMRAVIEACVVGLGYEFVDLEMVAHGSLRVTIDLEIGRAHV